jgi:TolB-like protein
MSGLFQELKRRNVFRVAIAYIAVAWLVLQVSDIVFESFGTPDWVMKTLMFVLAIGFPLAVLFAWAFEMTPEGIKKERDVDRSESITAQTGQKLNRTIIVVLLAAVGFLLVDKFMLRQPASETPTATVAATEKSVAVLPFVAMSRGPDDEYFADGLTEEILNSLTRVPELLVTARTSAFHFKGRDIPIPEIAAELGVDHVVEGSVRRDGERLRVTAQLIRAADGFHLWSENYDRETEDTFGVQTDIAEKIATALDVFLDDETLARMKESGLRNPQAYVAYQRGFKLYNEAHDDWDIIPLLLEANQWLDQVIALEPNFSKPYLLRADYYTHLLRDVYESLSPEEIENARERMNADLEAAARTATDEVSRWSAEYDRAFLGGDWRNLEKITDAYLESVTCPTSAWVNTGLMEYRHAAGAAAVTKKQIECDPRNLFGWRDAVYSLVWSGDPDEAVRVGEEAMKTMRTPSTELSLVLAYIAAGRITDAEALVDSSIRGDDFLSQLRVFVTAARGDAESARRSMETLVREYPDRKDIHLIYLPLTGDRARVNEIAAEIDALPYGYLTLFGVPSLCMCGAPWDFEVTPNFARKIEESGLPWPPVSPVKWPLKDW